MTTSIVTTAVVAGVFAWAMMSLAGLRSDNPSPANTQEEAPNYRFENVHVIYPYVDPNTGAVDRTRAGLEGTIRWTSAEYPGVHACTFIAYSPEGRIVGQQIAEVDAMSEGDRHPIPMSVSGPATSASITCDVTRLDTPATYEISDARVEPVLAPTTEEFIGARVTFEVVWPESVQPPAYPGTNACAVRFERPSGELLSIYHFTLSAPPGRSETPLIELSDIGMITTEEIGSLEASVTCAPVTEATG